MQKINYHEKKCIISLHGKRAYFVTNYSDCYYMISYRCQSSMREDSGKAYSLSLDEKAGLWRNILLETRCKQKYINTVNIKAISFFLWWDILQSAFIIVLHFCMTFAFVMLSTVLLLFFISLFLFTP